jgi:chromosome segregation ATPase
MSRKKGEESWMDRAIRLSVKLAETEDALKESRQETKMAEDAYNKLADAISGLRSQLEDMRKVRDRAVDNAEGAEMRLRDKQMELARCLGWIDAKMDKSPQIDDFGRIPF